MAFSAKNTIGTRSEGRRLIVLQSLMCSTPNPEAVMRIPPTRETSAMSSSEMNDLDKRAMP